MHPNTLIQSKTLFQLAVCLGTLATCLTIPAIALAQSGAKATVMLTVNGTPVQGSLFDQVLANNVAAGAKDSPELRQALMNEMIARTVLAQEAVKLGLDKPESAQHQLSLAREGVLVDLLLQKLASDQPINNDMLQDEYKRQLKLLADQEQVLVRNLVLETQDQAKEVLAALKAGASFEKLAQEKSLDASRRDGGSLGWLLPSQLIPPLANVVVNLNKGALAAAPIATPLGWQVIRLDDKRKFVPPTFEESKSQLLRSVVDRQRGDYVSKLMNSASIKKP